jgi:predicted enzyme related to lactoylglutathione lyase
MNGDRPAGGMYDGTGDGHATAGGSFAACRCDAGSRLNWGAALHRWMPGVGRMAVMTDPQGAAFAVIVAKSASVVGPISK